MAWTCGFFNSVNGDRTYTAEQISQMYEGMISNGVFASVGKELVVEPNSGMTIQINTGRGYFNNHWVRNDSELLLVVADSDVLLNRYAAVCIRVDDSDSVRIVEPYLKYGEFATSPTKPEMEHSEKVDEYCLAYIYIPAKATEIKASNIEDARGDNSVCGWVHVLIDQVDTTTLWNQYREEWADFMLGQEEEFMRWFENLQTNLEGDVAANLTIGLGNLEQKVTNQIIRAAGVLYSGSWIENGGVWQQAVAVDCVTDSNDVFITPSEGYKKAYSEAGVTAVSQLNGIIAFEAEEQPNSDIPIKFMIINDVA